MTLTLWSGRQSSSLSVFIFQHFTRGRLTSLAALKSIVRTLLGGAGNAFRPKMNAHAGSTLPELEAGTRPTISPYNSNPMDTNSIVAELIQQRDRVVAAIEALRGKRSYRRSPSSGIRRKMSAALKRKLSLSAKARWAAAKKAGKNAL